MWSIAFEQAGGGHSVMITRSELAEKVLAQMQAADRALPDSRGRSHLEEA
ncbi:MAG: hypothetical protein HC895_17950 [Leptolyngbyaceae cyanobacterium SM1_3_5]|nr:hypothetical protein [Leptolyngbyaceae cyanobacterium SM1_3_5]